MADQVEARSVLEIFPSPQGRGQGWGDAKRVARAIKKGHVTMLRLSVSLAGSRQASTRLKRLSREFSPPPAPPRWGGERKADSPERSPPNPFAPNLAPPAPSQPLRGGEWLGRGIARILSRSNQILAGYAVFLGLARAKSCAAAATEGVRHHERETR